MWLRPKKRPRAWPKRPSTLKRGPLGATIKSKGVLVPLKHESVSCKPDEYRGAY